MSFSGEVKKELANQIGKSRHCQIAELAAIVLMEHQSGDENPLQLSGENPLLLDKYGRLLKAAFGIELRQECPQISPADELRILGAFKLLGEDGIREEGFDRCSGLLLQKTCCRRAYLRGAFLSAGSISDPSKAYHFEIVCTRQSKASQLAGLMKGFALDAKIVERKRHFVVYLKEGAQIVDALNVMEAFVSLMNLENVRIIKEMRNSVNRKVNCETANIHKTVSAAVRQIEDIKLIDQKMGLCRLSENLRRMAELRLDNPELPLKELGGLCEPPVGKSGVNHRLRKISDIADRLRLE